MFVRRRLLKEKDQIIKWYQEREWEYQKELEEKQRLIEALREKAEEFERLLRENEILKREKGENLKQELTENTLPETDQFHDDGTAVLRPQTVSVSWELYPVNFRRKPGTTVFNPFKQW